MREQLLEYQDYLLAYRLRTLAGGKLRPKTPLLPLSLYAAKRLKRQALAKEITLSRDYYEPLKQVEALTDELNFGFWHNPSESNEFLRKFILQGGHRALESPEAFLEELLTPKERAGLADTRLIPRYYLGLLRASAAYLDAEAFTRLRAELEPLRERLPVFVLPE